MQPTDWIALGGLIATVVVAAMAQYASYRNLKFQLQRADQRQREQSEREEKLRQEQREREDWLLNIRRVHEPQIEFAIECDLLGPQSNQYIAEFRLVAHNVGNVAQKFRAIHFRVRGIREQEELLHWRGREPRVSFPHTLVDEPDFIPPDYNYYFVEPGVRQVFSYVTMIPTEYPYVLAYAEFAYDEYTPHTTERVFAVRATHSDP